MHWQNEYFIDIDKFGQLCILFYLHVNMNHKKYIISVMFDTIPTVKYDKHIL